LSFWAGFARAKGLGQKKVYVKTLAHGADGNQDISAATYATGGVLVTIRDLEKVDFAICQLLSSTGGAGLEPIPQVVDYSANMFTLRLVAVMSGGVSDTSGFSDVTFNGDNMSGVYNVKAFIVGEGRKEVA